MPAMESELRSDAQGRALCHKRPCCDLPSKRDRPACAWERLCSASGGRCERCPRWSPSFARMHKAEPYATSARAAICHRRGIDLRARGNGFVRQAEEGVNDARDGVRASLGCTRQSLMPQAPVLRSAIEEGSTCVRVGTALFGKRRKV